MSTCTNNRRSFLPPAEILRAFSAVVVASAVQTLQDWCEVWPRFASRSEAFRRDTLRAAQEADAWLLSVADSLADPPPADKFVFAELADVLGIDADQFIERLYGGLDAEAVMALWTLQVTETRRGQKPKPKTTALEARHATIGTTVDGLALRETPAVGSLLGDSVADAAEM